MPISPRNEEGIFGEFLDMLAIFICNRVYGGRKSSAEGIDLEFEQDHHKYIISIKSEPNWGNSRQIARMKDDFRKAKRILGNLAPNLNIVAVNGCCYGRDDKPNKGDYLKLCGQRFWEFISGNASLYLDIIEPPGYRAKQKSDEFAAEYSSVANKFTLEFLQDYCDAQRQDFVGKTRATQFRQEGLSCRGSWNEIHFTGKGLCRTTSSKSKTFPNHTTATAWQFACWRTST